MAKIECSIRTKILVTEEDQGMTSQHQESYEAGPSTEMPDVQAQPKALPNESLEVNFLRKERETLLTKISCLEQQVWFISLWKECSFLQHAVTFHFSQG